MQKNDNKMKEKKKLFKAYFLTCSLLSYFQEKGGLHSMIAEEDLFDWCIDLVFNKISKSRFIENIDFTFGLNEKDLDESFEEYMLYKNEKK